MTSYEQEIEDFDEDYLDDPIILEDLQEDICRNRNTLLLGSKINTEEKPDVSIFDLDEDTSSDIVFVENTWSDVEFVDLEEILTDDNLIENNTTAALPVTFFDISTNVELLNECRPLSIKVVDCEKHSWYYKNYKKSRKCGTSDDKIDENKVPNLTNTEKHDKNIISSESPEKGGINMSRLIKPRINPVNVAPYIGMKNPVTNNNDSEVITPVEKRTLNFKIADKIAKFPSTMKLISQVDLKRNKGLVGLKILQTSAPDERLFSAKYHKNKTKIRSKNTGKKHSEKVKGGKKSDVWVINKSTCEVNSSSVPVSDDKLEKNSDTDVYLEVNADEFGQFSNRYDSSATKIVLSRVKNPSNVTDLKVSDETQISSKYVQNLSGDATNISNEKFVHPKKRLLDGLSFENEIECSSKLDKTEVLNACLKISNTIVKQVRPDKTVASEGNAKEDYDKRSLNTKINDTVKNKNINSKQIGTKAKKCQKYNIELTPVGDKKIVDHGMIQNRQNTVILGNNINNITTSNQLDPYAMHIDDLITKTPISQQMFYRNNNLKRVYMQSLSLSKADETYGQMQTLDFYTKVHENMKYPYSNYVSSQSLNKSDSCKSKKRNSKPKKAYEKPSVNNESNNATKNNKQTKKKVKTKNGVSINSISTASTNLSTQCLTASKININKPRKVYGKSNHNTPKNKVLKHNRDTQSLAANISFENHIKSKNLVYDVVQNEMNRNSGITVFPVMGSCTDEQIQSQQITDYYKNVLLPIANANNAKNIQIAGNNDNVQHDWHVPKETFGPIAYADIANNAENITEAENKQLNTDNLIQSQKSNDNLKHGLPKHDFMPSDNTSKGKNFIAGNSIENTVFEQQLDTRQDVKSNIKDDHIKHVSTKLANMPSANTDYPMNYEVNDKQLHTKLPIQTQQNKNYFKHALPKQDIMENVTGINTQILNQQRNDHLKHGLSLSTTMQNENTKITEAIPEEDMANASNSKNITEIYKQILNQQTSDNGLSLSTSMPNANTRNTEAIPNQDMAIASNSNNMSEINTQILNQQTSDYFKYELSLSTSMPSADAKNSKADNSQLDTKQKSRSQRNSVKYALQNQTFMTNENASNPKNITETGNKQLDTNQHMKSQQSSNFSKPISPTQTIKHSLSIRTIIPSTDNITIVDKKQLETRQFVSQINNIEKSGNQSPGNNAILQNQKPCQVSEKYQNPGLPIETHVSNRSDPQSSMWSVPPRMFFDTARCTKPPLQFIPPNMNGPRFISPYLNGPQFMPPNMNDPRFLPTNLNGPPINYVRCAPIYDSMPHNTNMAVDNISSCTKNALPWSSVRPPPLRAPPPSVKQPSKLATSIAGSTIIGRNNTGVVRKINIVAAPVTEKHILLENVAKSLVNIKSTIQPDITSVTSKKEMLEILSEGLDVVSPPKEDLKRPVSQAVAHPNLSKILERKPKPGPSSKKPKIEAAIMPVHSNITTTSIPHKGYSEPILPIPTFQKSFEMIEHVKLVTNSGIEKLPIRKDILKEQSPEGTNVKNIKRKREDDDKQQDKSVKKISLDEYKKRVSKVDGKFAEWDDVIKSEYGSRKSAEDDRRPSFEQDLGYDSDSTVKL